jgi:predicted nucleic acid-binding protein
MKSSTAATNVLAFIAACPLEQLYISAVTLAELRFGIKMLAQGTGRRDELNQWLSQIIRAGAVSVLAPFCIVSMCPIR